MEVSRERFGKLTIEENIIPDDDFAEEYKNNAYYDVYGSPMPDFTNKEIITIKPSKKLKDKQIVIRFDYDIPRQSVNIELDGKYDGVKSSFKLNIHDWSKNGGKIHRIFKPRGVSSEDNELLAMSLDDCREQILEAKDNYDNREQEQEFEQEEIDKNKTSSKEFLFGFVEDHIKLLFKDQFGKLFGYVKITEDHYEIMSLTSHKFERYLIKIFYESKYKFVLSKEERNQITDYLQAKAEFNGIIKRLELRVAKTDDYTFYYDLTNSDGSVIKITPECWTVEKIPPILFRRYSGQLPQVTPSPLITEENGPILLDKFIGLLNIEDEDTKLLVKCYIISLFIPDILKPIDVLHGEQGSAKTSSQELIKMLVDPASVKTLTFPRDINELIQKLSHNYIAYFDNVSIIKDWISDALCRAVTGSGFSKRQLYTDDDDIIYSFKRCVGINGINIGATKPDLLDRSIIVKHERIAKNKRRIIEDIWNEFDTIKSELLGYIFNILVKVLQVKQNGGITIEKGLNRMADFEQYAEIISQCLGNKEGEFLRVYQDNINIQVDEAIAANALSQAIILFMIEKIDDKTGDITYREKPWIGTSSELLTELEEIAIRDLKININKIKSFPKSPTYLSRRLNEEKTNLREKGFLIETGKKDKKGSRIIEIVCKVASIASIASKEGESRTKEYENLDAIPNIDNVAYKVASKENEENQAQKTDFGRYGAIDATIHSMSMREKIDAGLFTNPLISAEDLLLENYPYEPDIINNIFRPEKWGLWSCNNCPEKDDKWGMMKHACKHNNKFGFSCRSYYSR